ncbi:MAG TPA: hypothetical protein VMG58_03910 [Candidatus Sulfotelmatobacter sp.]|nr:hypothetical protein [Candidatus Sulfotelmatobacter sp.]
MPLDYGKAPFLILLVAVVTGAGVFFTHRRRAPRFQEGYGMFLAGTLLSIVPIAVPFLALQGEFIAELTTSAMSG